jgi:hypothetical protein
MMAEYLILKLKHVLVKTDFMNSKQELPHAVNVIIDVRPVILLYLINACCVTLQKPILGVLLMFRLMVLVLAYKDTMTTELTLFVKFVILHALLAREAPHYARNVVRIHYHLEMIRVVELRMLAHVKVVIMRLHHN